MSRPEPITIKLTRAQIKALRAHFDHCLQQHQDGLTGILAAQVWSPESPTALRGCMRVGFVPSKQAKVIQRCAT